MGAGAERGVRKKRRDAVSCQDTSRQRERPCPGGESWRSQSVGAVGVWRGGRTPGARTPIPRRWMGHLPAPRALLGVRRLRRAGVLYGGEV